MGPRAHDAVARRAAEFFERRRFGRWSGTDQAELDAWLAESALHEVAYLRVEGIAAHTDRLLARRPPERNFWRRSGIRRLAKPRVWLPLLAAASVAGIAVFGYPLLVSVLEPPVRTYSTDVGGRTLLNFADRTQIELNTDTVVRFRMSNRERTVWLERGEAWFRVAHNAADPFVLFVGRDRVTDLGTEFFARRGADRVEVALLQGRAALSRDGAPSATLAPGDDAIATPVSMSVTRRTPQALADALAWRRGMLVFRNARLADAVEEFDRYNQTRLVIADPSIADLKFSAELRTDNLEGFLQLAPLLKLKAERQGQEILLTRASAKQTKAASAR